VKTRPYVPKPKKVKVPVLPCVGCEYEERACKVQPIIPSAPALVVLGDAPDEGAEFRGIPFADDVRAVVEGALAAVGYDLAAVAWLNLTRCRATGDDLKSAAHLRAEKRCRKFLEPDLARMEAPLLVLGERALHRVWKEQGRKPTVGAYRGLWIEAKQLAVGRKAFVVRHPRDIMASRDAEYQLAEFKADILRMARSLTEAPLTRLVSEVYGTVREAREAGFFDRLAARTTPWAFDIEAYDAKEFPSRLLVATDPCHPDFRLRGVAFAWAENEGGYVDLKDCDMLEASEAFTPVFASEAEKWAFGGHYDEEGVVYTKLAADGVCNRAGDGMLAMIALGDGTHDSLRLEKAVVDVLRRPQYWQGFDKSKMRDVPLADVADGAIGDACYTFELCIYLHERIGRADYLRWGR
jgi:uracil-DNA glycosylase